MKTIDYLKHPWKWRQASKPCGKGYFRWHLSLAQKKKTTVLFVEDSALYVPDGNGGFVGLSLDNPIARAIEKVPDMVSIARCVSLFEETGDVQDDTLVREAKQVITYIEGEKQADSDPDPVVAQIPDGQAFPLNDEGLRQFMEASSHRYQCIFDEGQRQMILLALQKLRLERPGFDYALSEIEKQLGGQIAWPDYGSEGLPNV